MQLELDEESQHFMVINTHRGLFKYTHLPFDIAAAPAVFQQTMDIVLQGLPGVVCYLDDIIVTGKDKTEHLCNLERVLNRIRFKNMVFENMVSKNMVFEYTRSVPSCKIPLNTLDTP